MDRTCIKNAVMDIRMPEDMKKRVIAAAIDTKRRSAQQKSGTVPAKPSSAETGSAAVWFKTAAAVLAVLLCLTLSIPVLAAVTPACELLYQVSPAAAQYFRPVQRSDEDNGIRMEVVSAYIHGDTAEICIAMQDLTGGRIDETTDLYDSYSIHTPFDSTARCERIGYDPATGTVTFLVSITQTGSKDITGDKITFSVKQILSHKTGYDDIAIPVNLAGIPESVETREVFLTGFSSLNYEDMPDTFRVILPGEPDKAFEVDGMDLTGIAFVDGDLHIQTAVKDLLSNDNHGYFYLVDPAGNIRYSDASCSFIDEASGMRTGYTESVFSISPEELAECTLYGSFTVSGMLTEGDWKVTFPLEKME